MNSLTVGDALFTKTQQRVMGLLFSRPDRSFYTNEIMRLASVGRGTVSRELSRLSGAGLLRVTREGNQLHYQANQHSAIYHELSGIVKKTFAVGDVIRDALLPLQAQIAWAFIYGSLANGQETAHSDIDVMVVGEPSFTEVVNALYPAQEILGREINPKLFLVDEWIDRRREGDGFIKDVLAKPHIDLIGDANGFG